MLAKFSCYAIALAIPAIGHATEYQIVELPRQLCWNEQVAVRSSGSGHGSAVIGGIAGGLLGHRIGKGDGRVLATAIGAATGVIVGDRMADVYPASMSFQTVQRCKTVVDHVRVPVVDDDEPIYGPVTVYHYREYYVEGQHQWQSRHLNRH